MFAAQLGHSFPGQVIQVSGAFIIHRHRKDSAIRNRIQILDQALTLFLGPVGVKSEKGRERERMWVVSTASQKGSKHMSMSRKLIRHSKIPQAGILNKEVFFKRASE